MFLNNTFIPLNKNSFLVELRRLGVPDATIEKINWKNCIHEGYCVYNDPKKQILCLTKIQNKNEKLCSVHRKRKYVNEIDEVDNMFKSMEIDENPNMEDINDLIDASNIGSETIIDIEENRNDNFINLDERNIEKLFSITNSLLNNIDKYKENSININDLCKCISEYNNEIYKNDYKKNDGPYIHITYLMQFFEELCEISNDFLISIINNYCNFDIVLNLCKKWKLRINEITKELIYFPDYYQEYYIIINKKIDNNLFKFLNNK